MKYMFKYTHKIVIVGGGDSDVDGCCCDRGLCFRQNNVLPGKVQGAKGLAGTSRPKRTLVRGKDNQDVRLRPGRAPRRSQIESKVGPLGTGFEEGGFVTVPSRGGRRVVPPPYISHLVLCYY